MAVTYAYTTTLTTMTCGGCQIPFAMPKNLYEAAITDGRTFYCPNGHSLNYAETNEEKLKRELEVEKKRLAWARDNGERQRQRAITAERQAAAYKGVATKAKKRALHGMCPVQGCRRHFANVEAHVQRQHPDYCKPE